MTDALPPGCERVDCSAGRMSMSDTGRSSGQLEPHCGTGASSSTASRPGIQGSDPRRRPEHDDQIVSVLDRCRSGVDDQVPTPQLPVVPARNDGWRRARGTSFSSRSTCWIIRPRSCARVWNCSTRLTDLVSGFVHDESRRGLTERLASRASASPSECIAHSIGIGLSLFLASCRRGGSTKNQHQQLLPSTAAEGPDLILKWLERRVVGLDPRSMASTMNMIASMIPVAE